MELSMRRLIGENVISDDAADINGGIPNDDACAAVHNDLPDIEDTHDDIPCVRHNENGTECFENPLEEHPGVYLSLIHIFIAPFLEILVIAARIHRGYQVSHAPGYEKAAALIKAIGPG